MSTEEMLEACRKILERWESMLPPDCIPPENSVDMRELFDSVARNPETGTGEEKNPETM